ncbi:hypothetical protein FE391_40290 [Nonomuraea sp. KC401]|uniref:hypothetical protein n=1 Tax=unclassified Nonomuraea TaxID=2593643 RepID=UPI0010FCDD50|nr:MULTISPECIES: hypothetical protein [unclassified Nonomuraea]NBE99773.1 hypothetical protein [Nonomuraea sp. K271]TLF55648.1 hypothetical protein FE391_40290 [Nonomuraea sp. KC401]
MLQQVPLAGGVGIVVLPGGGEQVGLVLWQAGAPVVPGRVEQAGEPVEGAVETPTVGQAGVRIVGRWRSASSPRRSRAVADRQKAASRQASARVALPLWWIETSRQTSTARIGIPAGPGRWPSSASISGMMPEASSRRL